MPGLTLPEQRLVRESGQQPWIDIPDLYETSHEHVRTVAQLIVGSDLILAVNITGHHTMRPLPEGVTKRQYPQYEVWAFDNSANPLQCLASGDPKLTTPAELLTLALPLAIRLLPNHAALMRR